RRGRLRYRRGNRPFELGSLGELLLQQRRQPPKILLELLAHRGRAKRRCGMEDRVEEHDPLAELVYLRSPAHAADAVLPAREQLRREVPERADDARLDQLDLLHQMTLAGVDLERLGVAVAGRPALQDVGHEALLA